MATLHDVRLTRTEKNVVFKWLQSAAFNPADFEWKEHKLEENTRMGVTLSTASTIIHRKTDYFFQFGRAYLKFSPGKSDRVETTDYAQDWVNRERFFKQWLRRLHEEVDAPDLWATIGQEKALSTAASSASLDNRPFTAAEQSLIATKLDEIKASLLDGQQFDKEQAEIVEREFAYLKESSGRLGRKDWLNILLGGLFGLAVTLALEPEKARGLLSLAGAVFQWVWGIAQGILQ